MIDERVAIWNGGPVSTELGGGSRENTQFKPDFDLALLMEEVSEFYQALARKDLVEMVDALCDVEFVMEGIKFKFGMLQCEYKPKDGASNIIMIQNAMTSFNTIEQYYYQHKNIMMSHLVSEYKITEAIMRSCFTAVVNANAQKTTKKDQKGKTMKGPKWSNPADKIKEILEKAQITIPEVLQYVEKVSNE